MSLGMVAWEDQYQEKQDRERAGVRQSYRSSADLAWF